MNGQVAMMNQLSNQEEDIPFQKNPNLLPQLKLPLSNQKDKLPKAITTQNQLNWLQKD